MVVSESSLQFWKIFFVYIFKKFTLASWVFIVSRMTIQWHFLVGLIKFSLMVNGHLNLYYNSLDGKIFYASCLQQLLSDLKVIPQQLIPDLTVSQQMPICDSIVSLQQLLYE